MFPETVIAAIPIQPRRLPLGAQVATESNNMRKRLYTKFLIGISGALLITAPLFSVVLPMASAQNSNSNTTLDPNCGEFVASGPLCLPKNPFSNSSNNSLVAQTTATGLIATVIRLLLYFAGIIAVLFLIIGGYYYLTARGNEEQATKGRQTLVYALLGLAIVILSYVIVSVITNQLTTNI